ncbi:MAG: hypothetical protein WBE68_03135 [Candidatus Nitrosopolaris sp.]|jgi:hypothetical protein
MNVARRLTICKYYDKPARFKLTYTRYQSKVECTSPEDELKDKFIEKAISIIYDEIRGQKGENHEGGSSKSSKQACFGLTPTPDCFTLSFHEMKTCVRLPT